MEKQIRLLKILIFDFFLLLALSGAAQTDTLPVFKGATKANREKTYNYIIKNAITKNLSSPLSDSAEEDWEEAFNAMELIHYKQPWVSEKIKQAFSSIKKRSAGFQRSLLELCYVNYPTEFKQEVLQFLGNADKAKNFAMGVEYLKQSDKTNGIALMDICIAKMPVIKTIDSSEKSKPVFDAMLNRGKTNAEKYPAKKIKELFKIDFLPFNTIVYSIQRKNRNSPGIVIVRGKEGNFIKEDSGNILSVPQLARSITNLPGYLTNGNTPQGIFRMYGFDVSKSPALGPTQNIQLTMPFETTVQHFLKDSSVTDTSWTLALYQKLLPKSLKDFSPLYETFYASQAGRTEIISHGTTVDPEYYKGQPYYPYTPTEGCLCTKEIWSDKNGTRLISDQQKLVNAVKRAGGADGYFIVIEIDDQQKPVSINDILPYIKPTQ